MSKTYIDDIDRSIYDMFDKNNSSFSTVEGLSKEIVIEISKLKNEPKWMLDLRLESLPPDVVNKMKTVYGRI